MTELNEAQMDLISAYIKQHGVAQDSLHEDLLDHVCTSMEEKMTQGASFEASFQDTISLFGPGGLKQVQQQTFELLTEINDTMKKVTFGFGLTSIILLLAGTIFKLLHLAGASMLIIVGAGLLILVYFPMILYHKLKEAPSKEYALHITGFLGLTFTTVGVLFKIMHWPFASMLLLFGLAFLGIFYVPIYYYKKYQTSVNKPITLSTSLVALTCLVLVFALTRMSVNDYDHGIYAVQQHLAETVTNSTENAGLYNRLEDNSKATQVRQTANRTSEYLEELTLAIISATEQISLEEAKLVPLNNLNRNRDYGAPKQLLFGDDESAKFHHHQVELKLKAFKEEILSVYPSPIQADVENLFPYDTQKTYDYYEGKMDWAKYYFFDIPASGIISQIAKLQTDIRQMENQTLLFLISQQEPIAQN